MSITPGDVSAQLLKNFKPKQLEYASQYDLREMVLTISGGTQSFDIRGMYIEFNLYEDMLGTCVSGSVTMYDTLNLLGGAALSGTETLRIIVDTPTKDNPIAMDFLVYGLGPVTTDPQTNSKRAQIYNIQFCSPEKLKDAVLLVQKSYKGTLISDMVKDIIGSGYINTSKQVVIEPTVSPQDIIIPAYRPLKAIDWLTTRAISSSQNPSYVFFENRNGFSFVTLETLFNTNTSSLPTYILTPKNVDDVDLGVPDKARRMQTIKDFEFIGTPDTLRQTKEGVFGSTLYTYDPVRMKFSTISYNILEGFSKFGIGIPPYVPQSGLVNFPLAKRYSATTNYNRSQTSYGADHNDNSHNSFIESFSGRRQSLLTAAETFKLRMMVNGDVSLTIGQCVNIAYPALDRRTATDVNKLDDMYSGSYLITAIRHRFTITAHHSIIEAIKGTTKKGLGRF